MAYLGFKGWRCRYNKSKKKTFCSKKGRGFIKKKKVVPLSIVKGIGMNFPTMQVKPKKGYVLVNLQNGKHFTFMRKHGYSRVVGYLNKSPGVQWSAFNSRGEDTEAAVLIQTMLNKKMQMVSAGPKKMRGDMDQF